MSYMRIFKNIWDRVRRLVFGIIYGLSFGMKNVNEEMLSSLNSGDISEKDKKNTRKLSNSELLEKFYAGQKDERYTQDFYEILKKADEFISKSDATKYGVTADKYSMSYGKKDKWGRRHEHYGFFDPKSRHHGKTLYEVIKEENKERKTNDDDYELLYIYDNIKSISLGDVWNEFEEKFKIGEAFELDNDVRMNILKKEKNRLRIIRMNGDVVKNKIEDLTDYVHVKRISDTMMQLEFFIDRKFKVENFDENSNIFKEIINIDEVWLENDYGEIDGYKVDEYKKRMYYNDNYEVIKFLTTKMKYYKR